MFSKKPLIVLSLANILLNSSPAFGSVTLVDVKSASVCTIVIPAKANLVEQFAARELQYHLAKSTGLTPPIQNEPEAPTAGTRVFLGRCGAAAKAGIDRAKLGLNAYRLKTSENAVFICGQDTEGDPLVMRTGVGTLFGVYDLLEKNLSVRWLWPGTLGEMIPKRETVSIPDANTVVRPMLIQKQWRAGAEYGGVTNGGYNGFSSQAKFEAFSKGQYAWLRRQRFFQNPTMAYGHSFTKYYDEYHQTHPEYFARLPDGTRRLDLKGSNKADMIAMCVSQPALWNQIVDNWKTAGKSEFINVCEDDTPGSCVCSNCLSWDVPDPENQVPFDQRLETVTQAWHDAKGGWSGWMSGLGSVTDRYVKFINAVYGLAAQERPDVKTVFYAYNNYVKPPIGTKLNRNEFIGLIPGGSHFPWNKPESDEFRKSLLAWSDAGASIFFRPNTTYQGNAFPVFYGKTFAADLSYGYKHSMLGVDFDALTGQYAAQGPTLYCIARALNQPDQAADQFLDEFYSAFGPAKPEVKAYFENWEKYSSQWTPESTAAAEKRNAQYESGWYAIYAISKEIFPPAAWETGWKLLARARLAAQGDPLATQRVAFLEKGLKHAWLVQETANAFEDKVDTQDASRFDAARQRLMDYRKSIEGDFVSSPSIITYYESDSWGNPKADIAK